MTIEPMLVLGNASEDDMRVAKVETIRCAEQAAKLYGVGSPIYLAMLPPRLTLTVHLEEYYGRKYVELYSPRVVLSNRTGWRRAVIRFALWVAGKAGAEVVVP